MSRLPKIPWLCQYRMGSNLLLLSSSQPTFFRMVTKMAVYTRRRCRDKLLWAHSMGTSRGCSCSLFSRDSLCYSFGASVRHKSSFASLSQPNCTRLIDVKRSSTVLSLVEPFKANQKRHENVALALNLSVSSHSKWGIQFQTLNLAKNRARNYVNDMLVLVI